MGILLCGLYCFERTDVIRKYNMKKYDMKKTEAKKKVVTTTHKSRAIILVILSTLFVSLGQIMMKIGSENTDSLMQIISNIPLILGFIAYGVGALLLIFSLKHGELSLVYPFIALSFIWVTLASIYLFNEHVSLLNWGGLIAIMIGISFIGYGGNR